MVIRKKKQLVLNSKASLCTYCLIISEIVGLLAIFFHIRIRKFLILHTKSYLIRFNDILIYLIILYLCPTLYINVCTY